MVVVDDSVRPYAVQLVQAKFAGSPVRVLETEPDVGISAGRNIGVAHVETDHFVLLDDDHVLTERSDIARMRDRLIKHDFDIVGGSYVEYDESGSPYVFAWEGHLVRVESALVCKRLELVEELTPCDIVNNFFVAKTKSVSSFGGWDPRLKVLEHMDFFLRAQTQGLRVAHLRGTFVEHLPERRQEYVQFRTDRSPAFREMWMRKHGLSHYLDFAGRVFRIPELHQGIRRPVGDYELP